MKKIFIIAGIVVAALLVIGALRADSAEINGGSKTGSYTNAFAPLIKKELEGNLFNYSIETSAGSVEAAERVLKDPSDVSLAQLDVSFAFMQKNPGKIILTNKLANECLFAVAKNPQIADWGKAERLATRLRIVTASEKSGSAFTLLSVMNMDPKSRLAKSASKVKYAANAKVAVEMVAEGKADMAFFVAYPNPDSAIFKFANKKKLNFIGVAHPNMRRMKTEQGDAIYTANTIAVEKSGWVSDAKTVQTACTAAVILTGNPDQFPEGSVEQQNQEDLVSILKDADPSAFKPKGKKWDTIFAAVKKMTGGAADSLWTAGGDLVETVAEKVSN